MIITKADDYVYDIDSMRIIFIRIRIYYITSDTILLQVYKRSRSRMVPLIPLHFCEPSKIEARLLDFCIIPLTATSMWLLKSNPTGGGCCIQCSKDLLCTKNRNVFILVVSSTWQGSINCSASNFGKSTNPKDQYFSK